MARPSIIILFLVLVSSAYAIPCHFDSWTVVDNVMTIPSYEEMICENETIHLFNTTEAVERVVVNGDMSLINSTVLIYYKNFTKFEINGDLVVENATIKSSENPITRRRNESRIIVYGEANISDSKILGGITVDEKLLAKNITLNGSLIFYNASNSEAIGIESNESLYFENVENIFINNSLFHMKGDLISIDSKEIVIENTEIYNSTSVFIEFREAKNITLRNVSFMNDIYAKMYDSNVDFVDTYSNDTVFLDGRSYFRQYFTFFYNITDLISDLPLNQVSIEAYDKEDNVTMTKTNYLGEAKTELLSYNKSQNDLEYFSNYTIWFRKTKYNEENITLNVSKTMRFNITLQTAKGIVPDSNCEFSGRIFCANENPKILGPMTMGDEEIVYFDVNATGNQLDILGQSFDFFIYVVSLFEEVETTESDSYNITIV